jgi:hypothetical protein
MKESGKLGSLLSLCYYLSYSCFLCHAHGGILERWNWGFCKTRILKVWVGVAALVFVHPE